MNQISKPNNKKHQTHVIIGNFYVDFNQLALKYRELLKHLVILNYQATINFKDQESLICLTKCLMKYLFKVDWNCPIDNLCPRIPNRMNYLCWVHHYLLKNVSNNPNMILSIIDIGTGSTCIYPLIGVNLFKNWRFLALETNQQSLDHSRKLVELNKLNDKIQFIESKQGNYLQGTIDTNHQAHVCICNPPFFEDQQIYEPKGKMLREQFATNGGEYEFFFQLYRQSFLFSNIKYFTCLIGTKRDYYEIKKFLESEDNLGILAVCIFGEIRQGNNSRFIVAWKPFTTLL